MSLRSWQSNDKLIERIARSIGSGSVSHAYIIEGDNCVDKVAFAKDFLKAVCCTEDPGYGCDVCVFCRKMDHDNCEDLYYIQSDGASVKDDMIEELQSNLSKKPMGSRNMAIIADADTMTVRAQNRLLKTLEEPYTGTVILLLSENKENLLETIRSRCIAYRLNDLGSADSHVDLEAAESLVGALLEGEKFFYLKQRLSKVMKTREDAFQLLDGMERIYRNLLLEGDARSRMYKAEEIFRNVSLIEEARRDLIRKVNHNYAMKNLLIKIGGLYG